MATSPKEATSVFSYLNYRHFLRDKFQEMKEKNPLFSYRSFNRIAGLKSPGFLKMVMEGKRDLSNNAIRLVARGFRLGEAERKQFELMVRFNQSEDPEEKDRYFRELSQSKGFIAAKPLTTAQYNLFSHWYYVAILELIRVEAEGKKDVHWIHDNLNPPVGLVDIKRAVQELIQLGLVTEGKEGDLKRNETMLKTEDEVFFALAYNCHMQMSEMAQRALLKQKGEDREFTTLTIATSDESYRRAKQRIREFRDLLHSFLEQEPGPKTVVAHLNLQLFRMNRKRQAA